MIRDPRWINRAHGRKRYATKNGWMKRGKKEHRHSAMLRSTSKVEFFFYDLEENRRPSFATFLRSVCSRVHDETGKACTRYVKCQRRNTFRHAPIEGGNAPKARRVPHYSVSSIKNYFMYEAARGRRVRTCTARIVWNICECGTLSLRHEENWNFGNRSPKMVFVQHFWRICKCCNGNGTTVHISSNWSHGL